MNFVFAVTATFLLTKSTSYGAGARSGLPSECTCEWTEWMNNHDYNSHIGDDNTYENLRKTYTFCKQPVDIECREALNPHLPFEMVRWRGMHCNVSSGLICLPWDRKVRNRIEKQLCLDYEIRVECCICPEPTVATTAEMTTPKPTTLPGNSTPFPIYDDFNHFHPDESGVNEKPIDENKAPMWVPIVIITAICIATFASIIFFFLCRNRCCSEPSKKTAVPREEYSTYQTKIDQPSTLDYYVENNLSSCSDTSCSSSARDYELSDIEDEYNLENGAKTRKTRSERDRMRNNVDYSKHSTPIYIGQNRRWFPDEHMRGIGTRPPQHHIHRPKPRFMSTFINNSRGNSPSIEEEFLTV